MDLTRRWRVATAGIVRIVRRYRMGLQPADLEARADLEAGAVVAIESGKRELRAWEAYAIERAAGLELGAIARMAEPMVMGIGVTGEDDRTPAEVWWRRMDRIERLAEVLEGLDETLATDASREGEPVTVEVGGERVEIPPEIVRLYETVGDRVRRERGAYLSLLRRLVGPLPETEARATEPDGGPKRGIDRKDGKS